MKKGKAWTSFNLHLYEERATDDSILSPAHRARTRDDTDKRENSQRSLQKPARKEPFPEANTANILIPKAKPLDPHDFIVKVKTD